MNLRQLGHALVSVWIRYWSCWTEGARCCNLLLQLTSASIEEPSPIWAVATGTTWLFWMYRGKSNPLHQFMRTCAVLGVVFHFVPCSVRMACMHFKPICDHRVCDWLSRFSLLGSACNFAHVHASDFSLWWCYHIMAAVCSSDGGWNRIGFAYVSALWNPNESAASTFLQLLICMRSVRLWIRFLLMCCILIVKPERDSTCVPIIKLYEFHVPHDLEWFTNPTFTVQQLE